MDFLWNNPLYNQKKNLKNYNLGTYIAIPDDSEIGYIVEVGLEYLDEKEKKTDLQLCPELKVAGVSLFTDYLKTNLTRNKILQNQIVNRLINVSTFLIKDILKFGYE